MARGGRKRRVASRYPCGDIRYSREIEAPFRHEARGIKVETCPDERNREVKRYRDLRVSSLAALFCEGRITERQLEAGSRFLELWSLWRRLFLRSPSHTAKAANLQGSHGHDGEETEEDRRRALGADRVYCEAIDKVFDAANGKILVKAVLDVVCFDKVPSMPVLVALQLGLDVLAAHFRVK